MFDRILIPTDGSDPALAAAREAFSLAAEQGASVHGLYVVEPIPLEQYAIGSTPATAKQPHLTGEQEDIAAEALAELQDIGAEFEIEITTAQRHGQAEEEIIDYGTVNDIDLIVMGTHGRSGVDRLVIGSVTERVVRQIPIKVLTIRG